MINTLKLSQELRNVGITTHGNCNSNGVVWNDDNKEIQDRADVKAVIANHDSTPAPVETLEEKITRIVKVEVATEVATEVAKEISK